MQQECASVSPRGLLLVTSTQRVLVLGTDAEGLGSGAVTLAAGPEVDDTLTRTNVPTEERIQMR